MCEETETWKFNPLSDELKITRNILYLKRVEWSQKFDSHYFCTALPDCGGFLLRFRNHRILKLNWKG